MKIKFTTNTNLKLPEVLSDTDMKYGFSLYNAHEHTTWDTEDSFKVKLLSKLDNTLSKLTVRSEDTKKAIEAVAEAVDYTNKNIDSPALYALKVQVNVPTILNSTYGALAGLTNKILKSDAKLDTNVFAGHIFRNDNIIILGTQLLKHCFSQVEKNNGIDKVSQFIFFHELSHGIERQNIRNYGENQSQQLVAFKAKSKSLRPEPNYGNINNEISVNKLHSEFALIDKQQFENLEIWQGEHYGDVSGLLHLREYQISKGEYNIENFTSLINDVISERHAEYEKAKKKMNEENEEYPSSNLGNTIKSANHYTVSSLEELKLLLPSLNHDALGSEKMHIITAQCTEKGYLKMLYALSNMHKEFIPVLNTMCSTFYDTDTGRAYLDISRNEYSQFMQNLKDTVGHDWIEKYDTLTKQIKTEVIETDRWMEMCFKAGASLDEGASEFKKYKEISDLLDDTKRNIEAMFESEFEDMPNNANQHLNTPLQSVQPTSFSVRSNMSKMKEKYETKDTVSNQFTMRKSP